MDVLHLKKNTFDRHENLFLLLIPIVTFLVTLATLASILHTTTIFSEGKTVAGQKTEVLDGR